jgi:peptide subunit release factor 1 (eRF1)
VNSVVQAEEVARRLIERRPAHRVITLYLDLDPEEFAIAPARASEIRSLLDRAERGVNRDGQLGHEDRVALREDIERIDAFLRREHPFEGAHGLAIFCAGRDELFEVVALPEPVSAQVVVCEGPYVEPLIVATQRRQWLVALVNRAAARILAGTADRLREERDIDEDVRGQHDQGGWSQANYERSVEKDVDDHLRHVARAVRRMWARDRYERLALGGPPEVVPRFEALLPEEVRARLAAERVEVDIGSATTDQVRERLVPVVAQEKKRLERRTLDRLAAGIGSGGRGVGGPEHVLEALNERRVETLLLEPGFGRPGFRCRSCGLLYVEASGRCPADGSELDEFEHLREAAIESALMQDAEIMVVRNYPDLGPFQGIGAILRF